MSNLIVFREEVKNVCGDEKERKEGECSEDEEKKQKQGECSEEKKVEGAEECVDDEDPGTQE